MRFAIVLIGIWWAVGCVLVAAALARYIYDPERPGISLDSLFRHRLFAAFFWWFMWLSPRGRETLVWLIYGDEE